jgi:hypothetical protein
MLDYIGLANMTPIVNVSYTPDRFNNSQSALYLNSGSCSVPPGVYFNSTFTITVWVNPQQAVSWQRILDFANGAPSDNVFLKISPSVTSLQAYLCTYYGTSSWNVAQSGVVSVAGLNQWSHLATVYNGTMFLLYINGTLQATQSALSAAPKNVMRQYCYIGRSVWFPNSPPDSNMFLDDLKIYNRALSLAEILADMMN